MDEQRKDIEVSQLLDGAAKAIASVHYCWLATDAEDGGVNLRPMGRLPREPGDDQWSIHFIADGRSRKASEIRRSGKVAVILQHDPTDAYVVLIGMARLQEEQSHVHRRWTRAYDRLFSTEAGRASAAFIDIDVERMELWIRGVTPEPFGFKPTMLERDGAGSWRLI